jgi:hypothetical protein
MCDSYCSHGGRCTKDPGHEGKHDSDYCTWTDAEAVTREQADEVLSTKAGGWDYLETLQPIADMIESVWDDGDH